MLHPVPPARRAVPPAWRGVATVVLLAIAFGLLTTPAAAVEPPPPGAPLTAVLEVDPGSTSVTIVASVDAAGGELTDVRVAVAAGGRTRELQRADPSGARFEWFGEAGGLAPGTVTVTLSADALVGGRPARQSWSTTADVGIGTPPASRGRPGIEPAPFAVDGGVAGDVAEMPLAMSMAADVVVYGATPSGVMAGVAAARSGATVVIVERSSHVGGMIANGLTATDYGHPATIGGITDEFFDRMQAYEGSAYGRWRFQPSSAETIFRDMLDEAGVTVITGEPLRESNGVERDGTRIAAIHTEAGRRIAGSTFIDASYEGDLMADAGVTYRIGRESRSAHGEARAGVGPQASIFTVPDGVDPAVPLAAPGALGSGDGRIQVSNYRLCFTTNSAIRVPFPRPADYDAARYDLPAAYIAWRVARGHAPDLTWFLWPVATTNGKFDVNNNGSVSIGLYGLNTAYPDGSAATRAEIAAELKSYTQGFLYFLANDSRVPQTVRTQMRAYGLCGDEWVDSGHWPELFYLREGRRMVGEYVFTERDIEVARTKTDGIAIGSYAFDSHHVSRWIDGNDVLRVEGGFWSGRPSATRWSIPYRMLLPRRSEATNLLVSVTVSATHVATAAIRMEPQYMLMGEAAGAAAAIAAAAPTPMAVHDVPRTHLQNVLRSRRSVIDNLLFWDTGSTPFRGDIELTFGRGITTGCSPVNFCPTLPTTRETMAVWLVNALNLPATSIDHFTDDEASPYEDDINRLASARITGGCGNGKFCPGGSVTRGQMAAFLVRAYRPPAATRDHFTDDETNEFEGDINRIATSGITAGCGGTRFCPMNVVTREQMSAFLRRAET